MIPPVVAVLLVAMIPAMLFFAFLATMTMVLSVLAEIDASDGRLVRG